MAQKKLLSLVEINYMRKHSSRTTIIILLILLAVPASGLGESSPLMPSFKPSKEDKAWANEVAVKSLQITLSAIKEKYKELRGMLEKHLHTHAYGHDHEGDYDALSGNDGFEAGMPDLNKPVLRVFVSSSMGKELLRQYVEEAKKYGAVLVFNGLPDGSWLRLSNLVMSISDGEDNVAMQIDDEAFKRFDIKSVPSFVLSEEEGWEIEQSRHLAFDKVNGNIGIRAALEMFAEEGDMAKEVEKMLNVGSSRK